MNNDNIFEIIDKMKKHTDGWPWYWLSYGEKCYAFATVEAYPKKEGDPYPKPGSELISHNEKPNIWIGENKTEMIIESDISNIESQNGDVICQFIAKAHAYLIEPNLDNE